MKDVSTLNVSFGRAVRDRRRILGLSQEELAWRGGLNRSYVTDIERGARNPSLKTIARLAEALEIPLYALLREAQEKIPERSRDNPPADERNTPALMCRPQNKSESLYHDAGALCAILNLCGGRGPFPYSHLSTPIGENPSAAKLLLVGKARPPLLWQAF